MLNLTWCVPQVDEAGVALKNNKELEIKGVVFVLFLHNTR